MPSGFLFCLTTMYSSPLLSIFPLSFIFWSFPWLSSEPSVFLTSYHLLRWSYLFLRHHIPSSCHQLPTWHAALNLSKAFQLRCPRLLFFQSAPPSYMIAPLIQLLMLQNYEHYFPHSYFHIQSFIKSYWLYWISQLCPLALLLPGYRHFWTRLL